MMIFSVNIFFSGMLIDDKLCDVSVSIAIDCNAEKSDTISHLRYLLAELPAIAYQRELCGTFGRKKTTTRKRIVEHAGG